MWHPWLKQNVLKHIQSNFVQTSTENLQLDVKDKPANRLGLFLYLDLFGPSAKANDRRSENVIKHETWRMGPLPHWLN